MYSSSCIRLYAETRVTGVQASDTYSMLIAWFVYTQNVGKLVTGVYALIVLRHVCIVWCSLICPILVIMYVIFEGFLINPLNAELNPICYLLTLLAHHFPHVSRIRVKSLTFR